MELKFAKYLIGMKTVLFSGKAEALHGLLRVWEMGKCLLYLQGAEAQVKDPKHSSGTRSVLGNFLGAPGGDAEWV